MKFRWCVFPTLSGIQRSAQQRSCRQSPGQRNVAVHAISTDVDLGVLFLSMFIQAIIGAERTQNCQDKLISIVA